MDYLAKGKLNMCCLVADPDLFHLRANAQRTHSGKEGGIGQVAHKTMKQLTGHSQDNEAAEVLLIFAD